MNTDYKHFNCTQKSEENYVSGLYNEREAVRAFLREKCKSGKIKYSTHEEVYKMLDKANFTRKN